MEEKRQLSPEVNFAKASIYQFLNGFGGPVWGAFVAYYGPLMALLGFLGASAFYNGVVNALFWLGFILMQIPSAYFSERLRYKKWAMGTIFLLAGTSMFIFGIVLLITGGGNKSFMLGLFLVCYAIATIVSGAATPLIFSLLFKIIPQVKLGSWLGIFFVMSSIGGLLGSKVTNIILKIGYPGAFVILFIGAFIFAIGMAVATWFIKEPEGELAPQKENFAVYMSHIFDIIKRDKNLVRFFVGMWIGVGHYVVITFYTKYALDGGFGIQEAQVGIFVSMNFLGWLLAGLGPLFVILFPLNHLMKLFGTSLKIKTNILGAGWIADKFGPKQTLVVFQCVAFTGVLFALVARSSIMFYMMWIFAGYAQICHNIGYSNMCLLSCPIEDKSSYIGLVNFAVFPFAVVMPMVFGWFIGKGFLTFTNTFYISMVLMVIAFLYFLFLVDNPESYKKLKAQREV